MKINFEEQVSAFYKYLISQGKTENTCKNYRTDLNCLREYLAALSIPVGIGGFSLAHATEFGEFVAKKYKSDNSIRRRIQTSRLFFDYLMYQGIVSSNPIKSIPTTPKFLDIPKPTSMGDVVKIYQYFKNFENEKHDSNLDILVNQRNLIIFYLIFFGGQKVSDIENILVDQIFIEENSLRVLITSVKKRDPISIPLPKMLINDFKKYLALLNTGKERFQHDFRHLLFSANAFRIIAPGLTPRGMETIFKEIRLKLKIDPFTPKSLRQSAIFLWIGEKIPDTTIKEWMGVAPHYTLKLYHDHALDNQFSGRFLDLP